MNTQLHFNKPFILVTRLGENDTNNPYHNPRQRYYEFDDMNTLFKYASRYMAHDEKPLSALRVSCQNLGDILRLANGEMKASEYFHDFPTALQEYRDGVRS